MGAICQDCQQEMGSTTDTCIPTHVRRNDGEEWVARSTEHFDEPDGRCHDCAIKHGGVHHFGCDVERCPYCGGQIIGCECLGEDLQLGAVE